MRSRIRTSRHNAVDIENSTIDPVAVTAVLDLAVVVPLVVVLDCTLDQHSCRTLVLPGSIVRVGSVGEPSSIWVTAVKMLHPMTLRMWGIGDATHLIVLSGEHQCRSFAKTCSALDRSWRFAAVIPR
jgi:hypothetical protein